MTSAAKIRTIWLKWMIAIFSLTCVGVFGNLILNPFLAIYFGFKIGPALSEGSRLTAGWILPLFNTIIILSAIAVTVYCASRPLEEIDYYAGLGGI